MAGAELEAVVGPDDGPAHRIERIPAGFDEARQLARHALVLAEPVLALERIVQGRERGLRALPGGRVRQIEPDLAVGEPYRIAPKPVAADQGLTGLEIELPVVPVAGQNAAVTEVALDQRIALVRAAVVAGVDHLVRPEQRNLLAALLHHHGAVRPQRLDVRDGDAVDRLGYRGALRSRIRSPHGFVRDHCRAFSVQRKPHSKQDNMGSMEPITLDFLWRAGSTIHTLERRLDPVTAAARSLGL